MNQFNTDLVALWKKDCYVCVGLDTAYKKIPPCIIDQVGAGDFPAAYRKFNRAIIDTTSVTGAVCAYKINMGHYGFDGGQAVLRDTVDYIHSEAPGTPVILDAKYGDVHSTIKGYVRTAFDTLHADAVTLDPYLGMVSNTPFLDYPDKGVFVLVRTSNPGSDEFQDLILRDWDIPLYQYVARRLANNWNAYGNIGAVVGATYPRELSEVRKEIGNIPILAPGIGAQGGDLEQTVTAGLNKFGHGLLISSSRGIIFASSGENFAEVAAAKTIELNDRINAIRKSLGY